MTRVGPSSGETLLEIDDQIADGALSIDPEGLERNVRHGQIVQIDLSIEIVKVFAVAADEIQMLSSQLLLAVTTELGR